MATTYYPTYQQAYGLYGGGGGGTTPPGATDIWFANIGNSIDTPGGSDTANPVYTIAAYQQLGSPSFVKQQSGNPYSRPGKTLYWLIQNNLPTVIANLRAARAAGTYKKAVITVHGGENDFINQEPSEAHDLQSVLGCLKSICNTLKAEATSGFAVQIVLVPCVNRVGDSVPSTYNSNRTSYNDWVRNNYATIADGFVEPTNQLSVWGDQFPNGAPNTYCSDGVHPTTEGARVMGVELAQTLLPYFGISSISPAYQKNIGYTGGATPTLSSIKLTGPSSITEGATGTFLVTATYSDSSTKDVTGGSSFTATEGTFSGGVLSIPSNTVTGDTRAASATATYNGKTSSASFTIADADGSGTYAFAAAQPSSAISQPSPGDFQQDIDDDGTFGTGTQTRSRGVAVSNNDYVCSFEYTVRTANRIHVLGLYTYNSGQAQQSQLPIQFYPEGSGRLHIFSDKGTLADTTGVQSGDVFVFDVYKDRIECFWNGAKVVGVKGASSTYTRDAGDVREFQGTVLFGGATGNPKDVISVRQRGVNLQNV